MPFLDVYYSSVSHNRNSFISCLWSVATFAYSVLVSYVFFDPAFGAIVGSIFPVMSYLVPVLDLFCLSLALIFLSSLILTFVFIAVCVKNFFFIAFFSFLHFVFILCVKYLASFFLVILKNVVNLFGWLTISVPVVIIFGVTPIVIFGLVVLLPFYVVFGYLDTIVGFGSGSTTNVAIVLYIILKRSKYLSGILDKPRITVEVMEQKWEKIVVQSVSMAIAWLIYRKKVSK